MCAHTCTHTELVVVKRRPAVCSAKLVALLDLDPSTGFPTHLDPPALEGMLAPRPRCASRTGVQLHRLEFWKKKKKKKRKNWGIS